MQYSAISIIYNPNSTGDSEKNALQLQSELEAIKSGVPVQAIKTKHAGHATDLAYKAAVDSKKPLIISSSGDGGYSEVINGALKAQKQGADPVCVVLPSGNANDHSRTLQNNSVFKLITEKSPQKIDLLKLSVKSTSKNIELYAHSYVGLGLTPVVATELNKTNLNALKELWIVIRTFARHRPVTIVHQKNRLRLDSIIFANIGEMAKVLTLSNKSKPDDGKFEVISFAHNRKLHLIKKLAKATVSSLDTAKQYEIYSFTTTKSIPAQIDGEVITLPKNAEITIKSEHNILKTLI